MQNLFIFDQRRSITLNHKQALIRVSKRNADTSVIVKSQTETVFPTRRSERQNTK